MTTAVLEIAEQRISIERRAVAHVHLSVYPPDGRVLLVAPERFGDQALRAFVIRKLDWIRQQQVKLAAQERESPRDMVTRESHYVWGQRRLLRVIEHDAPPVIDLHPQRLVMHLRPGTTTEARRELLAGWYRNQIRERALPLMERWSDRLGVRAQHLYVQHMKTRWGSCTPSTGSIRLNTELARKPPACLEYILVHELVHLREPTHGPGFLSLMDRKLPDWRQRQATLNRLPLRHEGWGY